MKGLSINKLNKSEQLGFGVIPLVAEVCNREPPVVRQASLPLSPSQYAQQVSGGHHFDGREMKV